MSVLGDAVLEDTELLDAVLTDVGQLRDALELPYDLAPEQAAIVTAPLDSALVVAGAGSGKTETMSLRVAWLVGTGQVRADEVLGLTFTRKAAGELSERVARAVGRVQAWTGRAVPADDLLAERATARTYHSFAAALVQEHSSRLHLDGVRLLGEAAAHQLAARLVEGWPRPLDLGLGPAQVTSTVLALSAACAEHGLGPQELLQSLDAHLATLREQEGLGHLSRKSDRRIVTSLEVRRELVPLVAAYAAGKREAGLLDHGDQVLLALEVARLPDVAAAMRAQHRVVLLDEYQDTSSVQTDLLAALFGDRHPVTAVGDPHQSIFGWRGASSGTLGRFLQAFSTTAGERPPVLPLSTSWRNPTRVLDVANLVAGPLRTQGTGLAPVLDVPTLAAAPMAGPGDLRVAWTATVEEEADQVVDWLVARRGREGRRSQAVLCRRRSQMARFEDALRARGVPVEVLGLGGLLDEPEVGDLVSVMTAAHDPSRGDAVVRLLTGPRWRLAPSDLDALHDRASELAGTDRDSAGVVDALDLLPAAGWVSRGGRSLSVEGRRRAQACAAALARVRAVLHRPAADVVVTAVTALGLDIEVAVAEPDPRAARRVLDRFVAEAAGYVDLDGGSSVGSFLAWLVLAREDERGLDAVDVAPDEDAVQVITVHSAKGLEWDDVAVVDAVAGGFPSSKAAPASTPAWLTAKDQVPWSARGDRDSLPVWRGAGAVSREDWRDRLEDFCDRAGAHAQLEERRLAYVAVTRAKDGLLVTGAVWADGSTPRLPSPYLTEVRDAGAAVVTWAEAPEDGAVNPRAGSGTDTAWPPADDPGRERIVLAAAAVRKARDVAAGRSTPAGGEEGQDHAEEEPGQALVRQWESLVDDLLAERSVRSAPAGPEHLSASQVVALVADPAEVLAGIRRPVPTKPWPQARRGSRFHEWVERRGVHAPPLLDPDEMVGAADDVDVADDELAVLKQRFLASEWADADFEGVEVPFETPLETATGRIVLRGRIDAVVRTLEGRLEVVDWKTGFPPSGRAAQARSAQLAVYRLALARLRGLPVTEVGAAFWYGGTGSTVRPADLLDEAGLAVVLSRLEAGASAGGGA